MGQAADLWVKQWLLARRITFWAHWARVFDDPFPAAIGNETDFPIQPPTSREGREQAHKTAVGVPLYLEGLR